jgi:small subunit ribosomal protein S9
MADLVQYYGTGRRKSSIARVFLRPGTGEWKVNGKKFDEHFVTEQQRVSAPSARWASPTRRELRRADHGERRRRWAQADAVKMGIARALMEFNPELRKLLKAEGLVTAIRARRNARSTGRRARARFQFSKR